MKFFTNEVKIALVAIVGIVVMFFGLQFLKGLTLFGSDNNYYASFDDVSGLGASSPVYANGYKVGVVEAINYDYKRPDNIVAVIGLDRQLVLPRGTRAEISSDLLGNVKLELRFGPNPSDLLSVGDTIEGGTEKGAMGKAAEMLPQLQQMLPRLDSILASVNALLADPALASSLHNVDEITAELTTTSRQVSLLTASLSGQMPRLMAQADSVLTHTDGLTRQLGAVDVAATMQKVDATLVNIEELSAALSDKEGTVGLLMRDPELYRHLSATMRDADSLLIDLRRHPKRYVHFSVFGKKDK